MHAAGAAHQLERAAPGDCHVQPGAVHVGRSTGPRIRFEYIVFARPRLSRVSMKLFFIISVAELNIRTLYTSMIPWSQLRMIAGACGKRAQTPYSLVDAAVFTRVLGH